MNQRGGAERVFAHIARAYPDAPVYTALFDARVTGDLVDPARVRTSYLAHLPYANRYFRYLAPFYPRAFERFDLRAYDVIVSSTTAWAKGVIVRPDAVHVCYINTVSRFAFAYDQYVGGFGLKSMARPMIDALVRWDKAAAQRPTRFVANSRNVADRIARYYGREADVLPCPVDVDRFTVGSGAGDYFFIASRLLPYKRIDVAIEASRIAGVPLLIAGTGPDEQRLRALAARTSTVTLLGYVDDRAINDLMGNARAALLPGEEDFGLVPLEAAAAGRPAIAYRAGGALETVLEGQTGEYFNEPTAESLASALRAFDGSRYDPHACRSHAETFAPVRFIERLRAIVSSSRACRSTQLAKQT
ncbi:MAG TPA: glycosyltransferase [Candidatus Baltobacteraceae bacterium]